MKAVLVAMVTIFVLFTKEELLSDFLTKNFPGDVYTCETSLTGIVTCVCHKGNDCCVCDEIVLVEVQYIIYIEEVLMGTGTAEILVALYSFCFAGTCNGHDALFCVLQRNGMVYKTLSRAQYPAHQWGKILYLYTS